MENFRGFLDYRKSKGILRACLDWSFRACLTYRIFKGILKESESYSLKHCSSFWNGGFVSSFSEERLPQTLVSKEKKNPLRSLVLISFELHSVTSYVFPVLWIPAFQTPLLVISRVFPFLCFTHPIPTFFFYSRVFYSCVPNRP